MGRKPSLAREKPGSADVLFAREKVGQRRCGEVDQLDFQRMISTRLKAAALTPPDVFPSLPLVRSFPVFRTSHCPLLGKDEVEAKTYYAVGR